VDRNDGKLISATNYAKVSWSTSKDATGGPCRIRLARPRWKKSRLPMSGRRDELDVATYDPADELFYVTAREQCDIFATAPQPYDAGHAYSARPIFPTMKRKTVLGGVRALIPRRASSSGNGSMLRHVGRSLSTAGGLVFTGDAKELHRA